jgi:hypothetical protein
MSRTTLVVIALLAALAPPALAGPPDGASGQMVFFDEVATGLKDYRKEKDQRRRIKWLERLAPTQDLRVAVALGDVLDVAPGEKGYDPELHERAGFLLASYYIPPPPPKFGWIPIPKSVNPMKWWKEHEADLRRRAKQIH